MKIVFPTNNNLSYLANTSPDIEHAKYFTVLDVNGQNIVQVEILKNEHFSSNDEMIKFFKEKNFKVLITPKYDSLPYNEIKDAGISVFADEPSQQVLKTFSDFIQDTLEKL